MKKVITIMGLFGLIFVQAQVGINKDKPDATLDIVAEKTDGSQVEGLLVPRISKEAAYNMAIASTKPQESNLVYVDNLSATFTAPTGDTTVTDITEKGYYSWNGTKWELINTSGNSIWSKTANGVELNDTNLNDTIQYSKDGYRIFDKSKTMVNVFDAVANTYSNISPVGSTNAYNYEQTLFKNVTKKSGEYLSGKKIEAIATADDAHPANTGMQALQVSTIVDGNNTNNYSNASGIFARSAHNGSGKISWLRAGYFDGFLGKKSKADMVAGVMSGAVTYSDNLTDKVVGSFSMGVVRGTGNVTNLIGQDVIVGGGKVETSSPDITANVENLYGTRYILGSKLGIAGRGGMTGTINNAYANYVNYQVDANTPINNVYGLYVNDLPNHATGDKYAIYTNAGEVSLGDVLILRKPGTAPTSPTDSSGKNGEIRYDGNYIYIKVGGQWKRTAFDTW